MSNQKEFDLDLIRIKVEVTALIPPYRISPGMLPNSNRAGTVTSIQRITRLKEEWLSEDSLK